MNDFLNLPDHAATMPLVGISANVRHLHDFSFHGTAEACLHAVFDGASCLPLILPALGQKVNQDDLIARLDGLLLTGAISNVAAEHYGETSIFDESLRDPARDQTTLPLIHKAIAAGLPILAICRGMQELNVTFGGSLAQTLNSDVPHVEPIGVAIEEWLAKEAHSVTLNQEGRFAALLNLGADNFMVNSSHKQGIARLADKLLAEAVADDGVIEAVSLKDSEQFVFGVQWHPEYGVDDNVVSKRLFAAFGQACRARMARRFLAQEWDKTIAADI